MNCFEIKVTQSFLSKAVFFIDAAKELRKNMKKSTTIIFVDLAAARWVSQEMEPAVRPGKQQRLSY